MTGQDLVSRRGVIEPKQDRSAQTLERLVDAAEELLRSEGLEAATVPRIAAAAGMSVGVVYRRFPEKEALLRLVCERYLSRSIEQTRRSCDRADHRDLPLEALVRSIIASMIRRWRADRGILRALSQYLQTQRDEEFESRAAELNAESYRVTAELLLPYAEEMEHPDPESAIRNGLLFVGLTLKALTVTDPPRRLQAGSLADRAYLEDELTRLYLGYLGVRPKGKRPRSRSAK
jgi:AcrR family transcriptional regulator